MNERIKQLSDIAYKNHLKNNPESSFGRRTDYDKKFAELIVRECIQVGGPEDSYTDDWFKAKADSINKIKEHFGVE